MEKLVLNSDRSLELIHCDEPVCPEDGFLVKTLYCGICSTDIKMIRSGQKDLTYPRVLGHEIVGEVVENRSANPCIKKGDVAQVYPGISCGECSWCRRGDENEEYDIIQNISPDIVFIATSGFTFDSRLIESMAGGGRVLLFSGFLDEKKRSLIDWNRVHYKEIIISGCYGSTARDNYKAVEMLKNEDIDATSMAGKLYPLKDYSRAFQEVESNKYLKLVFEM